MSRARARVMSVAVLSLACVRADASGSSSLEPAATESSAVAPTQTEVAKVCEHIWAVSSAESASVGEASVDFESSVERCVADIEAERQSIGDAEYQRQATCVLAAATVAELSTCEPAASPPPSPREPARFPEGADVRPLSEVEDHANYSPNPDLAELQQTKAARFDKSDGMSTVAFCIETNGLTSNIHTVQKFPGDPQIDQIIRDTIARWRFKPFVVDGAVVVVCTEKSFMLRFK